MSNQGAVALRPPDQPIAFARPSMGDEEAAAVAEVIRSGWVVGGPRLARFEERVAKHCGAAHGVAVSSWTTGAFLVLKCWGIGPGDEVIVPSLTFIASVNVILHAGATPVFVDVDPDSYNLDPADVARKVTKRTAAIIAVDQLGMPCDIDAINAIAQRHGLKVLDDAACALGSANRGRPVGGLAEVSVFSLHARKVVTTAEGGIICTNDPVLAETLRRQRHQGMSLTDLQRNSLSPTVFETYPEVGYNFRMTDIQGAIGLVQMDRLDALLARRRSVAERYAALLAEHPVLVPAAVPQGMQPNWQSYQARLRRGSRLSRNQCMEWLAERGIPTRRGVMASHREPPYAGYKAELPVTEQLADECLQLPMHAGLTEPELDYICQALAALAKG